MKTNFKYKKGDTIYFGNSLTNTAFTPGTIIKRKKEKGNIVYEVEIMGLDYKLKRELVREDELDNSSLEERVSEILASPIVESSPGDGEEIIKRLEEIPDGTDENVIHNKKLGSLDDRIDQLHTDIEVLKRTTKETIEIKQSLLDRLLYEKACLSNDPITQASLILYAIQDGEDY